MVSLRMDNFQREVIESDLPVLVDFYSDSCIACKRISPMLAELEEAYSGKLKLAKLNVNFDLDLAEAHAVLSLPTLVLFLAGTEQERIQGIVSKDDLTHTINQLLEGTE